jgi:hypothetical protein
VRQAAALRARDWEALDLEHLAVEVEDLPKEVNHHLAMALHYVLEGQVQPSPHENSRDYWRGAIQHHRHMLAYSVEDSPHLRAMLEATLAGEYQRARRCAAKGCKLPVDHFPEVCPWTLDQLLDVDFFPSAAEGG